ncbi:cytidine deaminase [Pseudobutyrivibrio ruminis]|uniref:cytidine deaminase n=1 Tax=Pseudobutyrivibrio ruminis TaxID=46206 RepID=UPI001A9A2F15|nr:cytidine deaminase [Pseudobutyrivibrio ruminis]
MVSYDELIAQALDAREYAYTPYSHHKVGAALLCTDGTVYTGCNVENAAYTPCNCAERTAVFKAVSEGHKDFKAIAIVGGFDSTEKLPFCAPCGVCRQVLMEFVDPATFDVVLGTNVPGEQKVFKLQELLPLGFGPDNLGV